MVTEAVDRRPPQEEILPLTDPAGAIAADILDVRERGTIRIFASDGALYDDVRISSALSYAKDVKEATIGVITGPLLRSNEEGNNIFLDLYRSGVVDTIHHRLDNSTSRFFNMVEAEGGINFTTSPTHKYPEQEPWYHLWLPENVPGDYEAENKKGYFDDEQAIIDHNRNHIRWRKDWKGLPLLVAEQDFPKLVLYSRERGLSFKDLQPDTLVSVAKFSGIPLLAPK